MCVRHSDDWDLFKAKGEFDLFVEGKYLHQVTFHWYEIELVAIFSKIVYYIISYQFFQMHTKNKGDVADGLEDKLTKKNIKLRDVLRKQGAIIESEESGFQSETLISQRKDAKKRARDSKYFFNKGPQ